jgi:hypothetical protein
LGASVNLWGVSWGVSWGGAWGVDPVASSVSGGFSRKPRIAIVTVEGVDYRVPVDLLQQFLESKVEKVVEAAILKVAKKRKKQGISKIKPPKIEIKSGDLVCTKIVEDINGAIVELWNRILTRKVLEWEDEEILMLLIGSSWH